MAFADDQSFYNQSSVLRISVMVVDDDPIFLQVMSRMLEKCKYKDPSIMEITVLVARDSMEALSALKIHRNNIDLIITDYYMPGMNGIQLKKQITQEFGNLPVIVMSSDTNKEEESLTCGAMCFIQKPIKPNDLTKIYEYAITYKRNGKSIVSTTEQNHKETDVNVPQQIETVPDVVANVMVETKKKKKHSSGGSDSKSVNTNGSCVSTDSSQKTRKRKPNGDDDDTPPASKKNKVTWTDELHDLFLQAIRHIGLDKAVPKKILEFMNIPQLTRENIASHLQKYRIFLRKVSDQGLRHSSLVPIRSRQSYYSNYYTPSTSWYETSLDNRSFYTKPRHGLGQSRLLSNTRFNQTSPYSYMNRSSTYEPRRIGSNLTLPIRSNLSITNQPSQNEGRSSLLESSMMANKTAQATPVIGFGSQHGPSAINGNSLNNDMVSSYGSLTPTQPGLGSYGSSSLTQPGLSSVARLRPSQTRVTSFENLISNQSGKRSLGGSTPNQAGLSNYGSSTPNQPIVDNSGSSTPNQLVVASFGSSTPNQAGLSNHGSLTPNQPIVDSFGSSTPNQLVVGSFGSSTPNQSRVSSFGSLTPSQSGLSSYRTLTSNQSGVSSYGSLTPNQAGLGRYGSLTPNQSGSITPNQSGVSSFGSLTPNQSGVSSFGIITPNQTGLSSFGSLTTNQSGVSSYGSLTPNQPGLSSFGSLTPNQSGLSSFGSLTPNQPGLGNFEGLTFNEPGSSSFSFGMQSFLNNEDEADKLPQPHANTNTQPNLDIPQLDNLNIFDDLGSIGELPFDTSSFLFDQNKQQEALDSINFDLPDLPTQLNQTCPLVEDIGGDWTFVNIDQDHFIGETSNSFVFPEPDFPNFNMNPTQNQEPDGSDFIDWSFLDRQDLVGDDFMDSVFNNDMD